MALDLSGFDISLLFSTLAGLLSVFFLVLGFMKQGKSKRTGRMFIWVGVVGIALTLFAPTILDPINGLFEGFSLGSLGTQSVSDTTQDSTIDVCSSATDTTVTLSAQNEFTAGAVGGVHRYRVNGAPALTVSDAGTFTASPGDELEILWTNASTTGSYFSAVSTEIVPCQSTATFFENLGQNGTLTMQVFNEEGNLIDTVQENETLGAGDLVNLAMSLQGQFQRSFPYGGVIVAEMNKTTINDAIVQLGGSETSVPSLYAITYGSESKTKAYTVPSITSNEKISGTLVLDANNPTSVNPAGVGSDVILTFYPNNYFINDDNGGAFEGPAIEDENDARTYPHTTAFTVQID